MLIPSYFSPEMGIINGCNWFGLNPCAVAAVHFVSAWAEGESNWFFSALSWLWASCKAGCKCWGHDFYPFMLKTALTLTNRVLWEQSPAPCITQGAASADGGATLTLKDHHGWLRGSGARWQGCQQARRAGDMPCYVPRAAYSRQGKSNPSCTPRGAGTGHNSAFRAFHPF